MKKLSKRQSDILDFIKKYTTKTGYPPTVREIGVAVGLNSTASVQSQLKNLAAMGYIERNDNLTRAIRIATDKTSKGKKAVKKFGYVDLPIIGDVAAGEPLCAESFSGETHPVHESILSGCEGFMLKVKGESMINAGIFDGDMVIVRSQQTAEDGEIVVARVDDEVTVKRFYRENGGFKLVPENDTMKPLYYDDINVEGLVVGLVRLTI